MADIVINESVALTKEKNELKQKQWQALFSTHILTSTNIHGDNALILLLRYHIENQTIDKDIWKKSVNAVFNKEQENSHKLLIDNTLNFLTTKPSIYITALWPLIEDKNWFINYLIKNNTFKRYDCLFKTLEIKSAFEKLTISTTLDIDLPKITNNKTVIKKI